SNSSTRTIVSKRTRQTISSNAKFSWITAARILVHTTIANLILSSELMWTGGTVTTAERTTKFLLALISGEVKTTLKNGQFEAQCSVRNVSPRFTVRDDVS